MTGQEALGPGAGISKGNSTVNLLPFPTTLLTMPVQCCLRAGVIGGIRLSHCRVRFVTAVIDDRHNGRAKNRTTIRPGFVYPLLPFPKASSAGVTRTQ